MSPPGLLSPISQYRDIFLLAVKQPSTPAEKLLGFMLERAKTLMDQAQANEDFFSAEYHRGIHDFCTVTLELEPDLEKFNEKWSHYV